MTRAEFLARPVDEEWERARRKETEDLERMRREEDLEEARQVMEYRRIGANLKNYTKEEVNKARKFVASLIRSGNEVEEMIVKAADKGELTPLVQLVVKTRLEVARQDNERDAIEALDLLQRRIEYEVMKRQASPALQFVNDLLNLHDGLDNAEWLAKAREAMLKIFPPEDGVTILTPGGFDISKHAGPVDAPQEDTVMLRIDFIREVDQLIAEVEAQVQPELVEGLDSDAVAMRLKVEDKRRPLRYVKELRNLALNLKW